MQSETVMKPRLLSMRAVLYGLALFLLSLSVGHAADSDGRFGVKGAAVSRCAGFVDVYENKKPELATFEGWIDGFVTGINYEQPGLFDLTPWQSNQLLAFALAGFCRENPRLSFFEAMLAMKQGLEGDALERLSPVVVARHNDQTVSLYAIVLRQLRERLVDRGHLLAVPQTQEFDLRTSQALTAFQRESGIEETGVPDQITVSRLMR